MPLNAFAHRHLSSRFAGALPCAVMAAATVLAGSVHAQSAAPGAGSILQDIKPAAPAAPSASTPPVSVQERSAPPVAGAAGFSFEVRKILIKGNTSFDAEALHALVADTEGRKVTLEQLEKLTGRITAYYRERGYPLARAIIPAQAVQGGVLVMEVIEARYGRIIAVNPAALNSTLVTDTLAILDSGQLVSQAELDRALLLLSDIPGISIAATVRPGEAVGTSDLQVDVAATPAFSGNALFDSYGNRYTGRERLTVTGNFFNPFGHGDVFSASAMTTGRGMGYIRLSYDALVGGGGTRLGGAYSTLDYTVGGPLAALDAHGTADVGNLWVKHPFIRGRDLNLYGQLQWGRMRLHDHVDSTGIRTDRRVDSTSVNLAGNLRDGLLSGGVTSWNLNWTGGKVDFEDDAARIADAASADTAGRFEKWNVAIDRVQNLAASTRLALALSGQWTNGNLDSSQKMSAAGPYAVRAYDSGVVNGDSGYLFRGELRHDLAGDWPGQLQVLVFFDAAHVTVNTTPWAGGPNHATLRGAGIGLSWAGADAWTASLTLAAPVGVRPELVATNNSARAWLEIGKQF